ncbi:MAG: UDP-N-acetylmuramate--L-alanine ligase [Oscillospiraceae bacterium]|nr:UDP-N-acetylmuramate--L-alanine ligase [Oscillospiraceae bacterium]
MERFAINELKKGAHIHFIGIGGISMSGLAHIALRDGFKVTGSDRTKSDVTDKLEKEGAVIYEGHAPQNVNGADLVVHTAAVKSDNPEMAQAEALGIRLIDRAEFLGAVMKNYKHAVGVSGTHGKTTTTSMLAHALIHTDIDPTISVGGMLDLIDGNIRCGKSDLFITEACEYTNSFLKFYPTIALITNIEEDHLDFFTGIEMIRESFRAFAYLTKGIGHVVAYGEDENIKIALCGASELNVITYGMNDTNDYYAENIVYNAGYPSFDIMKKGEKICTVSLNVPGNHNILNTLAVIAVCELLGVNANAATKGIETFKGTHRRFEKKGFVNGAIVLDDYAHHPTEIKATLKAAKAFPHNRIRCIFQPHTYSRTRTLWDSFVNAFDDADELIITHIYAAREVYDGVTDPDRLADEIAVKGINAKYIDSFDDIVDYIKSTAEENDIIFTMGAGDVTNIGPAIIEM